MEKLQKKFQKTGLYQPDAAGKRGPFIQMLKKYRHAVPLLIYGIIYLSWFGHLERTVTSHYRVIHVAFDDYIPFCEIFVVPYLLWFAYVAVVIMYFFFRDKDDYFKTCAFLFTGMTIFLLVSTLWPNGHHLRPYVMPRDNIFTRLVAALYQADTPTNYRGIRIGSFILCVSIVMSTVFIKQHSLFDVMTAFILAAVMYVLVYHTDVLLNLYHSTPGRRKRKPKVG